MGYFLLGSTSPDIRVITRERREQYHFVSLDFDAVGAGVKGLFKSHPKLMDSSACDGPTKAFIAGYISHLLADEYWIVNMFRPYFGNPAVFNDETIGKLMDRALQLEMDRQMWWAVDATLRLLLAANGRIAIDFISEQTLVDWREWVVTHLSRGFSWDRLHFMARRIAEGDDDHAVHQMARDFVQRVPESLEDIYQVVSRQALEEFKELATQTLAVTVGDYLR